MPPKLRKQLSEDPYYQKCARLDRECAGRITWEHALMYGGKQIQERFAILPLCVWHHLGDGLDKRWNKDMAMARATQEDKEKYPRIKWQQNH